MLTFSPNAMKTISRTPALSERYVQSIVENPESVFKAGNKVSVYGYGWEVEVNLVSMAVKAVRHDPMSTRKA